MGADLPLFELLVLAALVLAVVSLFVNRTVQISDSGYSFNEMSGKTQSDVLVMLLNLSIVVPLFLGKRPVEQRFVLAGIAVSMLLFDFLQAWAGVWFGLDGYSEGSWFLLKIAEVACLGAAYLVLRRRSSGWTSSPGRYRIPLIAVTVGCSAMLFPATRLLWNDADTLIEDSWAPDKSPFVVWLVLMALLPTAVAVVWAVRGSYAAQICLGTFAVLAALTSFAQTGSHSNDHVARESTWAWLGFANLVLAALAWAAVVTRTRSASPSSIDAAA